MPRNKKLENQVLESLDNLRVEFEAVYQQMRNIENRMRDSINRLDWENDKELVEEICYHLPSGSVVKFHMYDRLVTLQQSPNSDSEADSPGKKGDV